VKKILTPTTHNDEAAWITGKTIEKNEFADQGNGIIIEYSVKKNPIFYEDGRRKALISVAQNVTEHKRTKKILEKQNKRLDEIAWLQAHKARAPVARILGLANIINLTESSSQPNSEVLTKLIESVYELDSVIHKITECAEAGYLEDKKKNRDSHLGTY